MKKSCKICGKKYKRKDKLSFTCPECLEKQHKKLTPPGTTQKIDPYECDKCGAWHKRGKILIDHYQYKKPETPKPLPYNKSIRANLTQVEKDSFDARLKVLGINNISQFIRGAVFNELRHREGNIIEQITEQFNHKFAEILNKIDEITIERHQLLTKPKPKFTSKEAELEWSTARETHKELIKAGIQTEEHGSFMKDVIPLLKEIQKQDNFGLEGLSEDVLDQERPKTDHGAYTDFNTLKKQRLEKWHDMPWRRRDGAV